ncbi:MAG TPA: molybdopterin-binding protein [Candidatus Limnocylindrales bacterium]|nr:molybdopterin-binding protein [Candidatus Limnocylindrales bacterium]
MRLERLTPGRRPPLGLVGAVLARDLVVAGGRWSKGRRLSAADLDAFAEATLPADVGSIGVIVMDQGDLHEDEAASRLAAAVAGEGLRRRGPVQSRIDLVAEAAGVVHVRTADLERLNRLDPLEVFTRLDGSIVEAGDLVASVKVAPHVVPESVVQAGIRLVRDGARPVVRVAPFVPMDVAVVVKESLRRADRPRFEASVRQKVESLGSRITRIEYVGDQDEPVRAALARATRGASAVDVVLTAGGRSTDPSDPFFRAIDELGGRLVRQGVPAHPGSMLWLARIGRAAVMGLPTCGAYSKATAADLLLPRLLTGEPPTRRTVSALGHGGVLTREMRFRFPRYARDLDAPDG